MQGREGFTLLEVLVSLIILSLALGVIFQTLSQSRRISWSSQDVLEASRIAHNLFADTAFIQQALAEREKQGQVDEKGKWRFSASVTPLELEVKQGGTPIEIPSLLQLKLCLFLDGDSSGKSFCLTRWYHR